MAQHIVRRPRYNGFDNFCMTLCTQVQKETEIILERNSDLLQQNSTLKSEISELNASVENQKLKLCDARDELSRLKDNLKHKSKQTSKLKVSCSACLF